MNRLPLVVAFALTSCPLFAAVTAEEAAVQSAYARVMYSTELSSVNKLIQTQILTKMGQPVTYSEIQKAKEGKALLTISDFRLETRSNFGESKFDALELPQTPEFLLLGGSSISSGDIHGAVIEHEYAPAWSTSESGWKMDASKYGWVKKIATYTVRATFEGSTRTATAFAFFGDSQKEIEDKLVGSMIQFASEVDAYPTVMLHAGAYDGVAVRQYLKETALLH